MGVGSWVAVHVIVLLCIVCIFCELYLIIITLTELSHQSLLLLQVKRQKKNRVDTVGVCGSGLLTRERFWANINNFIWDGLALFIRIISA